MANYELYQEDGTTPITIPQPQHSSWDQPTIGTYADGSIRRAHYAAVRWRFPRLTATEYEVFSANRPASGLMTFKTFIPANGASPASYAKCTGVMAPLNTGRLVEGEYLGVEITWSRVEPV